ncbi:sensor histidine kinase [Vagococcus acidifermentans]|nr:sensor histidine kinase [Vagococcus acidifermentans]
MKGQKRLVMRRLMRIYSYIMIVVIVLFSIIVCVTSMSQKYKEINNDVERVAYRTKQFFSDSDQIISRTARELVNPPEQIDSLMKYFQLDNAGYLAYSLKKFNQTNRDTQFYLPNFSTQILLNYQDVYGIGISLDNETEAFYATQEKKDGTKRKKLATTTGKIQLAKRLIDSDTSSSVGVMTMDFNPEYLLNDIETILGDHRDVEIIAFKENDNTLLQYANGKITTEKRVSDPFGTYTNDNYLSHSYSSTYGVTTIAYVPRTAVVTYAFRSIWLVLLINLALIIILIVTLRMTFDDYVETLGHINAELNKIAKDDMSGRLDVPNKRVGELIEITDNVNMMLDRIEKNIKDIYQLEIEQKNAHMKALQAQINPHFLYNTLEYIRMYAVNIDADELADVVYAFASLLRNNISSEKTTTLEQELAFCEKYVYLYQMRYPDRIAYSFTIEESLTRLELPKFSLQPLVENYFVHGIDYKRKDNAIRLSAYRTDGAAYILVEDNGKGVAEEERQRLTRMLEQNDINGQSIGLTNVNERLKAFFGDAYSMALSASKLGGLLITIRIILPDSPGTHNQL